MEENRKQILLELKNMADEKYRLFHSNLCPNIPNILGVRIPVLRNYAKKIIKEENWILYMEVLKNDYYEEVMLKGMIIGLAKMPIEERMKYLSLFVPEIDNWAICDTTCAGLKFTNNNLEVMWDFLEKYRKSTKEFELRFAIVMMLDFYILDNYIDNVINTLNSIKNKEYYVKMAIAWALSMAYIKYPDKIMKYLTSEDNQLDNFTYNKTLQKIIESYRVSEREKNKMRKMKRRTIKI